MSGLRQRFFAWALHKGNGAYEEKIAARKRKMLSGLRGTVLEIGPGTGANLRYYANTLKDASKKEVRWIGLEPNPHMRRYLRAEAERLGCAIELLEGRAEHVPCEAESADAVVATLVLCSVRDVPAALAEIRRVLKPGGRFMFIEHVAAEEGSRLRRWQHRLGPAFHFFADGCHPDRETERAIRSAGFAELEIERFAGPMPAISLARPHIAGFAVKRRGSAVEENA